MLSGWRSGGRCAPPAFSVLKALGLFVPPTEVAGEDSLVDITELPCPLSPPRHACEPVNRVVTTDADCLTGPLRRDPVPARSNLHRLGQPPGDGL